MRFTDDEWMLMMLYSPGTRTGLIAELQINARKVFKYAVLAPNTREAVRWLTELDEEAFVAA